MSKSCDFYHHRYRYDTPLTPEELKKIIQDLELAGYHVIAVCCDMARPNVKCAEGLGVTTEQTWFPHPSPERKGQRVYWFYDPVHLLKLFRNWLLDDGFW